MAGADAVINCVGTFDRGGKNNFDAVQNEGAARIARLAKKSGVGRMVHISAIGADVEADSLYAISKGEGELGVLEQMPDAVILRPSVIFGPEDQFFNRFAGMTRLGPVLPIAGGGTQFQPVYVDDVAHAAELGATGVAKAGIYELGGPDIDTFRGLMGRMLAVINRRRLVISMPNFVARIMAFSFDMLQVITLGLFKNTLLTRDQLTSLKVDNVVGDDAKGFTDLGIEPAAMEAVLPDYLWRFRPSGQYDAIKDSARNLRSS
jgi:NADH dehydrogenase